MLCNNYATDDVDFAVVCGVFVQEDPLAPWPAMGLNPCDRYAA